MDIESVTERVYEQLSPHYESMNLKTRPGHHIILEWEEDGRYYEAEVQVIGVCDCTAEVMIEARMDRYEDDQAPGAYELYGPDRPTWREMFPNE